MKEKETSYNEKNKEESKIVFEKFPGDIKKNTKSKTNIKRFLLITFVIILVLVLFILSSLLNEKLINAGYENNIKDLRFLP